MTWKYFSTKPSLDYAITIRVKKVIEVQEGISKS
jgi:hypothetical protein